MNPRYHFGAMASSTLESSHWKFGETPAALSQELFNQLSSIGLQCLMQYKDKLEEITELVEETRRKTYRNYKTCSEIKCAVAC